MMWWSTEKKLERLLKRYLDPTREWTAGQDETMRELLRSSESARGQYNRRIVAHRLMLGLDSESPSRVERDRMRDATLAKALGAVPSQSSTFSLSMRWMAPVSAAAMAVLVVFAINEVTSPTPTPVQPQPIGFDIDHLAIRGHKDGQPIVGIGLSGVTAQEREYEVLHANAFLDDYLRFYYRCQQEDLGYLFLFGLQDDSSPIWYYPLVEEKESVEITCAADGDIEQMEFETGLAKRHETGNLRVIAIFSKQPVVLSAVENALLASSSENTNALAKDLAEQLELEEGELVRTLQLRIAPGTKGERHER